MHAVADIINLKRVRKAKAHKASEEERAANRAAFGRTKHEKALAQAEKDAANRKLDGHKRRDDT